MKINNDVTQQTHQLDEIKLAIRFAKVPYLDATSISGVIESGE